MEFAMIVNTDDRVSLEPEQRLQEMVDRAATAKDVGFDHLAGAHRYSFGPARSDERGEPLLTSRFQPLPMLSFLAGEFGSEIGYLTSVLVSTGLHPVQLAEDVATLDTMTGGRLSLGIGLGWMPYEFEAFNVELRQRVSRFEELLILYQRLLSGEEVTFRGKHFQVRDAKLLARSAQQPRPPLWVGANADPAVARAARLGDAWVLSSHNTVDDLERLVELYRTTREQQGKPQPTDRPITRMVFVAEDRETALMQAEPALADWYRRRGEWGWFVTKDTKASDEILSSGRWIIGAPEDCAEQIVELHRRLGATHVIMSMSWPTPDNQRRLDAIRLLGEEVLPRVRKALGD